MEQVIIDCGSGQTATSPLTDAQAAALAAAQAAAQAQATARADDLAWRERQRAALLGVSAALHDQAAGPDAAALAGLVHKLVADPPQPLSAPEFSVLARFVLRCLLP